MMGKDPIASGIRSLREEVLNGVSLLSKRRRKVGADTGKRGSESTFVHFRQLLQKGGIRLPPLGITGKYEYTALMWGEAGSGGVFPCLPFLCGNMEGEHFFENQIASTFVN